LRNTNAMHIDHKMSVILIYMPANVAVEIQTAFDLTSYGIKFIPSGLSRFGDYNSYARDIKCKGLFNRLN